MVRTHCSADCINNFGRTKNLAISASVAMEIGRDVGCIAGESPSFCLCQACFLLQEKMTDFFDFYSRLEDLAGEVERRTSNPTLAAKVVHSLAVIDKAFDIYSCPPLPLSTLPSISSTPQSPLTLAWWCQGTQ
jgi:hypothetical protein